MALLPDVLCHGDACRTLELEVETLHSRMEYIDACCTILNKEWPRSRSARNHSLMCSSRDYPASLVLVGRDGSRSYVIGHSRLCKILDDPSACWIESVIIDDRLRGKGFGRLLMELTEAEAKKCGFLKAHLSTTDRVGFYEKLGYRVCGPVVASYGGPGLRNSMKTSSSETEPSLVSKDLKPPSCFSRMFRACKNFVGSKKHTPDLARRDEPPPMQVRGVTYAVRVPQEPYGDSVVNTTAPPPPPPPPPPRPGVNEPQGDTKVRKSFLEPKVFMTKNL